MLFPNLTWYTLHIHGWIKILKIQQREKDFEIYIFLNNKQPKVKN